MTEFSFLGRVSL